MEPISTKNPLAFLQLAKAVEQALTKVSKLGPVLIVCVGTDRATGDALGPLVGTMLKEKTPKFEVWGNLEHPVHADNLETLKGAISQWGAKGTVIGVDSSLSRSSKVGTVEVIRGSINPGTGVGKELFSFGDIGVVGNVNVYCCDSALNTHTVQVTSLHMVMTMAKVIAEGIHLGVLWWEQKRGISDDIQTVSSSKISRWFRTAFCKSSS